MKTNKGDGIVDEDGFQNGMPIISCRVVTLAGESIKMGIAAILMCSLSSIRERIVFHYGANGSNLAKDVF